MYRYARSFLVTVGALVSACGSKSGTPSCNESQECVYNQQGEVCRQTCFDDAASCPSGQVCTGASVCCGGGTPPPHARRHSLWSAAPPLAAERASPRPDERAGAGACFSIWGGRGFDRGRRPHDESRRTAWTAVSETRSPPQIEKQVPAPGRAVPETHESVPAQPSDLSFPLGVYCPRKLGSRFCIQAATPSRESALRRSLSCSVRSRRRASSNEPQLA